MANAFCQEITCDALIDVTCKIGVCESHMHPKQMKMW